MSSEADRRAITFSVPERKDNKINLVLFEAYFDELTNYDETQLLHLTLEKKKLKRYFFIRLITFPIEYSLIFLLLGKTEAAIALSALKVLWRESKNGPKKNW